MRQHGTRSCYVQDKCHCDRCKAANTASQAAWRRRKLEEGYGARPPSFVDAGPARQHVRALMAAGVGRRRVAELAGVAPSVVGKLIYGARSRGQAPAIRIRPATERKLLAVKADVADGAHVDSTGTRRRLQALMLMGWSGSELGRRIGVLPTNMPSLIHGTRVTAARARAVRHLYEELRDRRPTARNGQHAASIARATAAACRLGWAPPAAWDHATIDDPAGWPDVGERPRSHVVDLNEVQHLAEGGCSLEEIARRMNTTVASIEREQYRLLQAAGAA